MGPKKEELKRRSPRDEPFGELTKEMLLIQISDLEEKLGRSRRKCKTLMEANALYQEQYEQLEDDRQDTIAYMKRILEQRADELVEVQNRLQGVNQKREIENKENEHEITHLKSEFQETKDQLTTQLAILTGKLNTLEEFRLQKEELLQKFCLLEAKLQDDQAAHKEELYELDRKTIIDKDRLKRDMIQRVNKIASDFRKVSNKRIADTTKRMMRENVSMSVTLAKVSEKTAELLEENFKLKSQHHNRQMQIDMLEATEMEMSRKNRSHLRIIKLLNSKCNTQEVLLSVYQDLHEKFFNVQDEVKKLFLQCESIQGQLMSTQEYASNLEKQANKLNSNLLLSESKRVHLQKVLLEAAKAIQDCLLLSTSNEPYDKSEAFVKRESLLNKLFNLLSEATSVSAPMPIYMGDEKAIKGKSYAEMFRNQQYKKGSLGLVPYDYTTTDQGTPIQSVEELFYPLHSVGTQTKLQDLNVDRDASTMVPTPKQSEKSLSIPGSKAANCCLRDAYQKM